MFEKEDISAATKVIRKTEIITAEGAATLFNAFVNEAILLNSRMEIVLNYKPSNKVNTAEVLCPKDYAYSSTIFASSMYPNLHAVG